MESEMITDIDEDRLNRLVVLFYERVRADTVLGPIFDDAIHDWPLHLEKLAGFWSSVMLTSGRYKGNPFAAHVKHKARITPALFDRWLALWQAATAETFSAEVATVLQAKAARIAESLKAGLFFRPGPEAAPDAGRAAA
jgi:hemoglobin